MNTQEMYDKVVNHLRAQGNFKDSKDMFHSRGWQYINPNNPCQRCAKGILMGMESLDGFKGWQDDIEYHLNQQLTENEVEMLNELEYVFEDISIADWEENFNMIAERSGVKYTPPAKQQEPIKTEEEEHAT